MSVLSKSPPLKSKGLAADLGQCVGGTVEDVQLRRVTLTFSVATKRVKSRLRHLRVERLNYDCCTRQHVIKFRDSCWTIAGLQNDPTFQNGYRRNRKSGRLEHCAAKTDRVRFRGDRSNDRRSV